MRFHGLYGKNSQKYFFLRRQALLKFYGIPARNAMLQIGKIAKEILNQYARESERGKIIANCELVFVSGSSGFGRRLPFDART